MPAWEGLNDIVSTLAIMDGTQRALSSGKYALRPDHKWGGRGAAGNGQLERWMVFNSGWSHQPQTPQQLFGNSKCCFTLINYQHHSWLHGQADWCPLCAKFSGSCVKIRKGKFNALCYYMWKWWISSHVARTKGCQQEASQEAKVWRNITCMFNSQQCTRLEIDRLYHLLLLW